MTKRNRNHMKRHTFTADTGATHTVSARATVGGYDRTVTEAKAAFGFTKDTDGWVAMEDLSVWDEGETTVTRFTFVGRKSGRRLTVTVESVWVS